MPTLKDFIASHLVFRSDEASAALPGTTPESIAVGLNYHVTQKHCRRIRRGLYTNRPKDYVDQFVIASRITDDAVIAYLGAINFHNRNHDDDVCYILTQQRFTPFTFAGISYRGIRLAPKSTNDLKRGPRFHDGIEEHERDGVTLRVCAKERAYADCFDRLDLTRGLEDFAELFLHERDLDPRKLVDQVFVNGSRIAAARLGLLMEVHPKLKWEKEQLARLERMTPKSPTVFDPAPEDTDDSHLVSRWNAIIPAWFHQMRGNLL